MQGTVEFRGNSIIVRGAYEIKDILTIRGYHSDGNEARFSLNTADGLTDGMIKRFRKELAYISRLGWQIKDASKGLENAVNARVGW